METILKYLKAYDKHDPEESCDLDTTMTHVMPIYIKNQIINALQKEHEKLDYRQLLVAAYMEYLDTYDDLHEYLSRTVFHHSS